MHKQKIISAIKNISAIILIFALFIIVAYQNRNRDFFPDKNTAEDSLNMAGIGTTVFEGFTGGEAASAGDDVAVLTVNALSFINEKGKNNKHEVTLSEPRLHTRDNHTIYYDKNEKEAAVFTNNKLRYRIETENKIIKAKVAFDARCLIVTEKEGYNCEVMVYDKTGDAVFKWSISEGELLDVDMDTSCSKLVISQLGTKEGKMQGQVVLVDMAEAKIIRKDGYDAEVFYNVMYNRNGMYTALGSKRVMYFNKNGTEKWSYEYNDRTLLNADVKNPDMMVMAFSSTGSKIKGNVTEIEILDRLGRVKNKTEISGRADDITANNTKIAIAFGKKIYLLNEKLEEIKISEAETGVRQLAFFGESESVFVLEEAGGRIMK